jgi:hypothetical protein
MVAAEFLRACRIFDRLLVINVGGGGSDDNPTRMVQRKKKDMVRKMVIGTYLLATYIRNNYVLAHVSFQLICAHSFHSHLVYS